MSGTQVVTFAATFAEDTLGEFLAWCGDRQVAVEDLGTMQKGARWYRPYRVPDDLWAAYTRAVSR